MSVSAVRLVDHAGDIDDALWEACFAPPLEGRWWYEALEGGGLEDQFRFRYAVLTENGRDVGIAPMFTMQVPMELVVPAMLLGVLRAATCLFPGVRVQRTLFIGSPCADEGTLGLLPGIDRLTALAAVHGAAIAEARRLDHPMMVWKDFPALYDEDFLRLARSERLFRMVSFPGTRLSLRGSGRDGYLAQLGSTHNNNYRRKLRRSRAAVELDVEILTGPSAARLDRIYALYWQTYSRAATRFERLTPAFFERIARAPCARFLLLREQGRGEPVAFMLYFELGTHLINKYLGFDYSRPRNWMLYFRLWDAFIDNAIAIGARSIQSGQTGYRPKVELGHALEPLANYCRHRNPLAHWIYARAARTVSWATLDPGLARHSGRAAG